MEIELWKQFTVHTRLTFLFNSCLTITHNTIKEVVCGNDVANGLGAQSV